MYDKKEIALNSTFDKIVFAFCFSLLIFFYIRSLHLDIYGIDAWLSSFKRATFLGWVVVLFALGIIVSAAFSIVFIFFRVPYKVVLNEHEIRLYIMFAKPKTIKWENINRFEIITSKRYRSQISLLIESAQFSTEGWPKKRPGFSFEVSVNIDKARALSEKKMVREIADNGSIYPDKKSQFGEDINN